MTNVTNKVIAAWYQMLNNLVSVPVYRYDAPPTEYGDYILLRVESDGDQNTNNQRYISNPVIITEVVTRSKARLDDIKAANIDNQITLLLSSTPATHNLPSQDGIGITRVRRANATYLPEDDGETRYLRLITRYTHRVEQLTLT
jgi:hypothetical protein